MRRWVTAALVLTALGCAMAAATPAKAPSATPKGCAWHAAEPAFQPSHYLVCPAKGGGMAVMREPSGVFGTDDEFDENTFAQADAGDAKAMRQTGDFHQEYWKTHGDAADAAAWFRKAADAGDIIAMVRLAQLYRGDSGAPPDTEEARRWLARAEAAAAARKDTRAMVAVGLFHTADREGHASLDWYRMAADAGDPLGMYYVGTAYHFGIGVESDGKAALAWYRKAAEGSDPDLAAATGSMFRYGQRPATKDGAEAVRLFRKAVDGGYAHAALYLAGMYAAGEGVAKDEAQAARWYRVAAEVGEAEAMDALAAIYQNGNGVTADAAEAEAWRKAAQKRRQQLPGPVTVITPRN